MASLEGALIMSRLQRNDEVLRRAQSHLNRYRETEVAAARQTNMQTYAAQSGPIKERSAERLNLRFARTLTVIRTRLCVYELERL